MQCATNVVRNTKEGIDMDICLCRDNLCARFKDCYRAQATPNPYMQSFFGASILKKDGSCDYFIKNPPELSKEN